MFFKVCSVFIDEGVVAGYNETYLIWKGVVVMKSIYDFEQQKIENLRRKYGNNHFFKINKRKLS